MSVSRIFNMLLGRTAKPAPQSAPASKPIIASAANTNIPEWKQVLTEPVRNHLEAPDSDRHHHVFDLYCELKRAPLLMKDQQIADQWRGVLDRLSQIQAEAPDLMHLARPHNRLETDHYTREE